MLKHGCVVRPIVYLASLDIKTAFDEARPTHVAQMMDSHNTHGWLIAALLREMSGLDEAMFECVESRFRCQSVLAPGKRRGSSLVVKKMAHRIKKRMVFSWTSKMREVTKFAALCGLTTFGSCRTRRIWSRCYKTSLKKQIHRIWYPNQQICGGQVRMILKKRLT